MAYENTAATSALTPSPASTPSRGWWLLLVPILTSLAAALFFIEQLLAALYASTWTAIVVVSFASLIAGALAGLLLHRLTRSTRATFIGIATMSASAALLISLYNALERQAVAMLGALPAQPGFSEPPFQFPEVQTVWWLGLIVIAGCGVVPQFLYFRKELSSLHHLTWYGIIIIVFIAVSLFAPFLLRFMA